jgi:hypothetical protein
LREEEEVFKTTKNIGLEKSSLGGPPASLSVTEPWKCHYTLIKVPALIVCFWIPEKMSRVQDEDRFTCLMAPTKGVRREGEREGEGG